MLAHTIDQKQRKVLENLEKNKTIAETNERGEEGGGGGRER